MSRISELDVQVDLNGMWRTGGRYTDTNNWDQEESNINDPDGETAFNFVKMCSFSNILKLYKSNFANWIPPSPTALEIRFW